MGAIDIPDELCQGIIGDFLAESGGEFVAGVSEYNIKKYCARASELLAENVIMAIGSIDYDSFGYLEMDGVPVMTTASSGTPVYTIRAYIGYTGDLSDLRRESVLPKRFPEGVANIIRHMERGWDARGFVYGYWKSHRRNIKTRQSRHEPFLGGAVSDIKKELGDVLVDASICEGYAPPWDDDETDGNWNEDADE